MTEKPFPQAMEDHKQVLVAYLKLNAFSKTQEQW